MGHLLRKQEVMRVPRNQNKRGGGPAGILGWGH
jgi:hypothetical protein